MNALEDTIKELKARLQSVGATERKAIAGNSAACADAVKSFLASAADRYTHDAGMIALLTVVGCAACLCIAVLKLLALKIQTLRLTEPILRVLLEKFLPVDGPHARW